MFDWTGYENWKRLAETPNLRLEVKDFMRVTQDLGFIPYLVPHPRKDDHPGNYVLECKALNLKVEFSGWVDSLHWGLYDLTKKHPDPINAGMTHIEVAHGGGSTKEQGALLAAAIRKFAQAFVSREMNNADSF